MIKKTANLLKPNGHLILLTALEQSFYRVADKRFFCLSLTEQDLLTALQEANFKLVEKYKETYQGDENANSDCAGLVFLLAQKQ